MPNSFEFHKDITGIDLHIPKIHADSHKSDGTDPIEANIDTVTSNTTVDLTNGTILVDSSSGNIVITLPASAEANKKVYNIKKIDSSNNTVTIDGESGELIDGASTAVITIQYESITIQSNGIAWYIL